MRVKTYDLFAAAPKGIEPLLARELVDLGASKVSSVTAGASFRGSLETAYRVCLWSRTANRVLLALKRFPAASPEELYTGIQGIQWSRHLSAEGTLAVSFHAARSRISHTQYGAQRVKDAIVDQFRAAFGMRPTVDLERPDVRVNVYLFRNEARVSLDLSGESLHRRGYRREGVKAPLKENLAATILLLAEWPDIAEAGRPLIDVMCGSGTLPIEAALMAADIAPGLLRSYFGFLNWKGHDPGIWVRLLGEARERRQRGILHLPSIIGFDRDRSAVRAAKSNIEQAGLGGRIHVELRDLSEAHPVGGATGLVVVNPPYGERLGEKERLDPLYLRLGEVFHDRFPGWKAVVFTGNPELGNRIGLRTRSVATLYNGSLECALFTFQVPAGQAEESTHCQARQMPGAPGFSLSAGAEMLVNRLRKNLRHTGRWARRNGVSCYRLYDADLPEYALAVDLYSGSKIWVHVQEYAAPRTVDSSKAEQRVRDAREAIIRVLEIPEDQLFLKIRRRQKGNAQYEKLDEMGDFHEVSEDGCRLLVNFTDYLDTGLFLDHRITRRMIQDSARNKRFLNLFGYTGAVTVRAAAGGAASTTTVDLSNTYLDWARRNLALNGFRGKSHRLIQEDCMTWVEKQAHAANMRHYDLIFLDPPTFSNSKRINRDFDVQGDHKDLIRKVSGLLSADGVLIFSTNSQRFRLDSNALRDLTVRDITRETIPPDFARHRKIHQCWRISRSP